MGHFHKLLCKCHCVEISIYSGAVFLCKYLHFCFVENLRTSLRKIYGHVPPGINGYFYIKKNFILMGMYIISNVHIIAYKTMLKKFKDFLNRA